MAGEGIAGYVRNWLEEKGEGGRERIRVRAAMNGTSVPPLGSDPLILVAVIPCVPYVANVSDRSAARDSPRR